MKELYKNFALSAEGKDNRYAYAVASLLNSDTDVYIDLDGITSEKVTTKISTGRVNKALHSGSMIMQPIMQSPVEFGSETVFSEKNLNFIAFAKSKADDFSGLGNRFPAGNLNTSTSWHCAAR